MKIISITIDCNGIPITIINGRIFLPAFGTTINNGNMHWSKIEVPKEKLKPELINFLKEKKYV